MMFPLKLVLRGGAVTKFGARPAHCRFGNLADAKRSIRKNPAIRPTQREEALGIESHLVQKPGYEAEFSQRVRRESYRTGPEALSVDS